MVALTLALTLGFCKNPVPAFEAIASNGVKYSNKSFVEKPTVVVFLKKGCPSNPSAAPHFNQLAKSLGSSANVVAFVNGSLADAKEEAKRIGATFPLIPDPKRTVITGCGASKSLDFTIVATAKEAKFPKLWEGYSKASVGEALEIIVKHGKKLNTYKLDQFPADNRRGCTL